MSHNLLQYIPRFIEEAPTLSDTKQIINRANGMGEALEDYIKCVIAQTINENSESEKAKKDNSKFSWLGNQNNIPDLILRGGDAIEIKKVESFSAGTLPLNSSPPKKMLFKDDSRMSKDAKTCEEDWESKNLYYIVGVCPKNSKSITDLFFVDGACYAAEKNVYQKLTDSISKAANSAENIEFKETNELAGIGKVDPLGITSLRVRGMWHIETPYKVFSEQFQRAENKYNLGFIARKEKYDELEQPIKDSIEEKATRVDENIAIRNPDNPAQIIHAVFIKFEGDLS